MAKVESKIEKIVTTVEEPVFVVTLSQEEARGLRTLLGALYYGGDGKTLGSIGQTSLYQELSYAVPYGERRGVYAALREWSKSFVRTSAWLEERSKHNG